MPIGIASHLKLRHEDVFTHIDNSVDAGCRVNIVFDPVAERVCRIRFQRKILRRGNTFACIHAEIQTLASCDELCRIGFDCSGKIRIFRITGPPCTHSVSVKRNIKIPVLDQILLFPAVIQRQQTVFVYRMETGSDIRTPGIGSGVHLFFFQLAVVGNIEREFRFHAFKRFQGNCDFRAPVILAGMTANGNIRFPRLPVRI